MSVRNVPVREVIECWARREHQKDPGVYTGEFSDASRKALIDIIRLNGPLGTSRILWEGNNIGWSHTTLSEHEFRNLRVHKTPPETGWRKIAPDGSLESAAQHYLSRTAQSAVNGGMDDEWVDQKCIEVTEGGHDNWGPLILFREEGEQFPWLVDGNHRATALMADLLRGGSYDFPLCAYVGVRRVELVSVLRQKFRETLHRLRGDTTGVESFR
jgi:hypothetical protein